MAILSSFSTVHIVAAIFYIETKDEDKDDGSTTGGEESIKSQTTDLELDNSLSTELNSDDREESGAEERSANEQKPSLAELFKSLAKNYKVSMSLYFLSG